ncbi:uncharacterized protein EI90DRAFT_3063957, partial [Cantharellus anzutake]|uniref:uncharacterized protein n=1 Tax=Cantharellus anzutake TaxID=1750568 RepID=UPI001905DB2E
SRRNSGFPRRFRLVDCSPSLSIVFNHGERIWSIAKAICDRRKIPWPANLDISYIMAAPIIEIKATNGRSKNGETRLFRIVVLECTWQLWKARCRRVMNPDRPQTTLNEVRNAPKSRP